MPTPPNVVVVHAHNSGQHFGCYGVDIETPHLDSLAADGVQFENAFCPSPHCSPARASLWTGAYPQNHGLVGLAHLGWELNEDYETLFERLGAAGYTTSLFGIQHVAAEMSELGFDRVEGSLHEASVDEPAAEVAERVVEYLHGETPDERPFFASVGFNETHGEMVIDNCLDQWTHDLEGYDSVAPEAVDPPPHLPDRPGIREDLRHMYGQIHAIDAGVGRIRAALEATGLAEDTLLVFVTDHGLAVPRAMGTCYDPGVEVAMLLEWPGTIPSATHDALVSTIDFAPTVLDLVGETPPPVADGRSFEPLLTGGEYEPRDHVYLSHTWHEGYNPIRAIRTERYKYVRNFGDLPQFCVGTGTQAGREMLEEAFATSRSEEELYDLEEDPHEQDNVVDDPEYAEVATRLSDRVAAWINRTDPYLPDEDWPPTDRNLEFLKKAPYHIRSVGNY